MNDKSDFEILVNLIFDKNSVENHLRNTACDMTRVEILFNPNAPKEKNVKELHQEKYEILREVFFETMYAEFLKVFSLAEIKKLIKIYENPLIQRFLTNTNQFTNVYKDAISKKIKEHLQKLKLQQTAGSANSNSIN